MNDRSTREALASLLAQEGTALLENPKRLEALLLDLCPERKREIVLIANAHRERVPEDLLAPVSSLPPQMLRIRLQKRLEDHLSITEPAAVWAVETWALALGVVSAGEVASPSVLHTSVLPQSSVPPQSSISAQSSVPPQGGSVSGPPPASAPAPAAWPSAVPPPLEQPAGGYPPPASNGSYSGAGQPSQPGGWPPPQSPGTWPPQNPGTWPPQAPGTWPPAPNPGYPGQAGFVNDSGMGNTAVLPAELKGFNWGAFLLNWIWAISNKSNIGLLALVPYVGLVMAFVLGYKGNEMAWQNRRWTSIDEFKAVQKKWAVWGWVVTIVFTVLGVIVLVAGDHSS